MDQVAERKYEVLKCLSKEVSSLESLRELSNRSAAVSRGMTTILDSFEHRLAKLETTILPVYQQTGNLQRRHHNIEKTLAALDHVLSFYNAAGETEGVIRGGRPGEGSGGVAGYLQAMDKLDAACTYFKTHNQRSVELSNVSTLFSAGSEALSREFRDELSKHQRPLNPVVTLDLIALETDELSEEAIASIELIPALARDDLALISAWLDEHAASDKLTVYAATRAHTLAQSLQTVRDHQRSNSAEWGGVRGLGGAATPTTGTTAGSGGPMVGGSGGGWSLNSPAPTLRSRLGANKLLDPTGSARMRPAHNKLSSILERKANWMLQRAKGRPGVSLGASPNSSPYSPYTPPSFTSSPYSPAASSATSPGGGGAGGEDGLDDSDVLLYLTQVTALCRLGLLEQRLVQQVVPVPRQASTLDSLLAKPLEKLVAEGEHVASCGLRSMQRGDSSAILCLLALLRHLSVLKPEYLRLMLRCQQPTLSASYSAIANTLQHTVVQCLEVFVDGVRGEGGERALPKDGTVHQQTSNALIFLQQLQEYTGTLGGILVQDGSLRSVASVLEQPPEQLSFQQSQSLLAAYTKRVLSNLGLAIVQRSEAYSDATLRAIFRLNNYNYLLSTLLSTGALANLETVEPSARSHYNQLILHQKKLYSQSWSAVLHYLSSQDEPAAGMMQTPGKMRDRDRQIIKDKFAGFNKEIEELQHTQRSYSLPDRQLRESIKRDNKEFILPKYQAFYDKYSAVPFSRNTEKYVKYSPADVSALMDKFFDVAA